MGFFLFLELYGFVIEKKHALSLLNYLFVSIYLNQNEDLYLCCNFSFELVPLLFLRVNAFLFKPNYAANLRAKDIKTPNFLLQSQPSYMFSDSTELMTSIIIFVVILTLKGSYRT